MTNGGISSFTISGSGICSKVASASSNGDAPAYMAAFTNGSEVMAMDVSVQTAVEDLDSSAHLLQYNSGTGISYTLSSDKLQFTNPIPISKFPVSVSHPHMVYQYGSEVFIPDLVSFYYALRPFLSHARGSIQGGDTIWRLAKTGNSWSIAGSIPQPTGSGPRHIQTKYAPFLPLSGRKRLIRQLYRGSMLFVLHELGNTLSSQPIPSSPSANSTTTISSLSTLPSDITNNYSGRFHAGELILSPDGAFLYASNRDTATSPDSRGDSIAIFSVDSSGRLSLLKQVFTGLQILRGMTLSPDGTYIVAGGQTAGGIVVYERVNGGADLSVVARNSGAPATTSYVWL